MATDRNKREKYRKAVNSLLTACVMAAEKLKEEDEEQKLLKKMASSYRCFLSVLKDCDDLEELLRVSSPHLSQDLPEQIRIKIRDRFTSHH